VSKEKIDTLPKISFGIIVLNGEPFTKYCLRSLYPFAYEIIVVEGACRGAESISTYDGHSIDGTLDALFQFKHREDPENKLRIVTKDGFWSEKDEQSRAYASIATGDYLWQVDIDEFYKAKDIITILDMLNKDPDICAVSFKQLTFWGSFEYLVDSWYLKRGAEIYHRLFKWGRGYTYITHRPPTVLNEKGQNLRELKYISGYDLAKEDIFLYHYSLVFPKQVKDKCQYYANARWAKRTKAVKWFDANFMHLSNPYRVHNVYQYPSWLFRFKGSHPEQIKELIKDIQQGFVSYKFRRNDDVEKLLNSKEYRIKVCFIKKMEPVDRILTRMFKKLFKYSERIFLKIIRHLKSIYS